MTAKAQAAKKFQEILPQDITFLLREHFFNLMPSFFETQSSFLSGIYKKYHSIETANIILCFARNIHLEIIRQREKNLNFDVSIEKFWKNFNLINKPSEKISSIVNITGIPKETVRRKLRNLINAGFLSKDKNKKGYIFKLLPNQKDDYLKIADLEVQYLSRLVSKFANYIDTDINMKIIENEIKSKFSFYWYHFLSAQLEFLKMWQLKLNDNDLLLIALQTTIPTLQYVDKNIKKVNVEEAFKVIGQINDRNKCNVCAVSATSVSEVTGIPRATCIRKLEKLVALGFLIRETKTKRYFVNQATESRTKNILTKHNVNFTIETYCQCFAIILNSLVYCRT